MCSSDLIFVYAHIDMIITRLLKKGYSNDRIDKILKVQLDSKFKMQRSSDVIYNDGSFDDLKVIVEDWIKENL